MIRLPTAPCAFDLEIHIDSKGPPERAFFLALRHNLWVGADLNNNGRLDSCEGDGNGILDFVEISRVPSLDCDGNCSRTHWVDCACAAWPKVRCRAVW